MVLSHPIRIMIVDTLRAAELPVRGIQEGLGSSNRRSCRIWRPFDRASGAREERGNVDLLWRV